MWAVSAYALDVPAPDAVADLWQHPCRRSVELASLRLNAGRQKPKTHWPHPEPERRKTVKRRKSPHFIGNVIFSPECHEGVADSAKAKHRTIAESRQRSVIRNNLCSLFTVRKQSAASLEDHATTPQQIPESVRHRATRQTCGKGLDHRRPKRQAQAVLSLAL